MDQNRVLYDLEFVVGVYHRHTHDHEAISQPWNTVVSV